MRNKLYIIFIIMLCFLFRKNFFNFISFTRNIFINKNSCMKYDINLDILNKYNDLSKLNNINNYSYNMVTSYVLTNNMYNSKTLIINSGKNKKIKINDVVINDKGIIGLVKKVNKNTSIISSLNNEKIMVKVNNEYGVLYYDNSFYIDGIDINSINNNDPIYTSPVGNIPSDIYVGRIIKNNNSYYVFNEVDYNNINYVKIIRGN